jgi:hypothetical protein
MQTADTFDNDVRPQYYSLADGEPERWPVGETGCGLPRPEPPVTAEGDTFPKFSGFSD